MNLGEIRTAVAVYIGDENQVQYSNTTLNRYINMALTAIAEELGSTKAVATFTTLDNLADEYSGGVALPSNFVRVLNVLWDNTRLIPLENTSLIPELFTITPQTSTPSYYLIQMAGSTGTRRMVFYPHLTKAMSGFTLKVEYHAIPATLTSDSDVPGIPLHMHEVIVLDALRRCFIQSGEFEAARFVARDIEIKMATHASENYSTMDSFGEVHDASRSFPGLSH